MSPPKQYEDVDTYADEIKRERDRGAICVGSNLLLTPAEIADPDWELIIEDKAEQAKAGLIASARTLALARRATP